MRNGGTKRIGVKRAATVLALSTLAVPALGGVASAATSLSGKLAKAGVQQSGDLSGWTVTPGSLETGSGSGSDSTPFNCGGTRKVDYVAGDSAMAIKGSIVLLSGSAVARSVGAAESDLQVSKSSKAVACLKKSMGAGALGADGSMTIKRVSDKVSGTDQSAVFRIVMKETAGASTLEVDGYLLEARVGRSELSVWSESSTSTPSLTQATKLLKKMAHRVRAV